MTNEQLIEKTKELAAIESTAHNPKGLRKAYDFMVDFLLAHHKDISIEPFEKGGKLSLLAYKGAKRPQQFHIILNGHLDVVPGNPEQYEPKIVDGKLYGRGVYDMKAACIVLADVFCEYVDQVPFALGLQIVTDEESAGKQGTLYQVEQGVRADFVICGDCGRLPWRYEIANETKGIAVAEIGFTGTSAHGAYPWNGDNAIIQAMEFAHALHKAYPAPLSETFDTTVTVTAIGTSNTAHTKVPDNAVIKLDARFTEKDPNFRSQEDFAAFIKKLDPRAEIISMYDFCLPAYSNPNSPLLLSLKAAAEATEGHEFNFVMRHGTGDGRFYANVGNETCEFGVAGENQHGDSEYITLEAFENYRATLRAFLRSEQTLSASPSNNRHLTDSPVL